MTGLGGPPRGRRTGGFTLMEVMVALAILGVSFTVILELLSVSVRSTELSDRYTCATVLAQNKMEELLAPERELPAQEQGTFADAPLYRWEVRAQPAAEPGVRKVVVEVTFSAPGGLRRVTLETLKADRKLKSAQ